MSATQAPHIPASPPLGAALGEPPSSSSVPVAGGITARKRLSSLSLLGNEREVEIEHGGQLYRLRLTSLGKLILTK